MFGSRVISFACGATLIVGCSGTNTPSSADGGAESSGRTADGGAGSSGSGGSSAAPTATCQSGQTNVADDWYAVPECKEYFDTSKRCSCAAQTDVGTCEKQFATSLASSLCYPQGLTFSTDTVTMACTQALKSYKQANPKCS